MILLKKRRSHSETRQREQNDNDAFSKKSEPAIQKSRNVDLQHTQSQTHLHTFTLGQPLNPSKRLGRRKTSAELISEAKVMLGGMCGVNATVGNLMNHATSVGGLRLVSTRRPITPRENGRALYGKVALAGRPPSAFSLRYLQNEGNRTPITPTLMPIASRGSQEFNSTESEQRVINRSQSLDFNQPIFSGSVNSQAALQSKPIKAVPRKLPSLENRVHASDTKKDLQISKINTIDQFINSNDSSGSNLQGVQAYPPIKDEAHKFNNVFSSNKILMRNHDLLSQSSTERLIELLKELAGLKDCTAETVNHVNAILSELYGRVSTQERNFKRGTVLGGLYGLVECSSSKILLSVARVVLALRVTGSNLTGACKLIFKVARHEQNDYLFHENDLLELLIDGLGRASPFDDPEACIYGYGSIRFITSSTGQERIEASVIKDINKNLMDCRADVSKKSSTAPLNNVIKTSLCEPLSQKQEHFQKLSKQFSLVERLARHGAVELIVLHLQILNEAGATQKLQGPPLHSLYQLSAALRALADVRKSTSSLGGTIQISESTMTNNGEGVIHLELACPHLIRAAEISIGELEVQANIIRTLSVLSEDIDCCEVLVNFTARIGMLLGPCCEMFDNSSEKLLSLLSRLGYTLGNLMAKYDKARVQFYHNDVAMEYLLNVLALYSEQTLSNQNSLGDTVIDVLIKMIRVVANMSVNTEVGLGLGNMRAFGSILLNLLNVATQVKPSCMKSELDELFHATLGALHNLCFYQDQNVTPTQVIKSKDSLQNTLSDLAIKLCLTLRNCTDEATQSEIARVLGNLTRSEQARPSFCRAGGLPLIIDLLCRSHHQQYDLKACTIGVLVNVLGDWENRTPFLQLKGPEVLLELLEEAFKHEDWFLATIICQAMWNLLIDTAKVFEDTTQEHVLDDVCDLLVEYLDEERIFVNKDNNDTLWEDFAVVATDLLERIQSNYENNCIDEFSESVSENDNDDVYIEEI